MNGASANLELTEVCRWRQRPCFTLFTQSLCLTSNRSARVCFKVWWKGWGRFSFLSSGTIVPSSGPRNILKNESVGQNRDPDPRNSWCNFPDTTVASSTTDKRRANKRYEKCKVTAARRDAPRLWAPAEFSSVCEQEESRFSHG